MMKECFLAEDHFPELNSLRGLGFAIGAIYYTVAQIEQDGVNVFTTAR